MKNGYDQFFKSARAAAQGDAPAVSRPKSAKKSFPMKGKAPAFAMTAEQFEENLKRKAMAKRRKRKPFPWQLALVSFLGVAAAGWGTLHADQVEKLVKNVEIEFIGSASAAEGKATPSAKAKTAETKEAKDSKEAKEASEGEKGDAATAAASTGAGEPDHLAKLNDREKELNTREEEIGRQEQELARMKEDLEKRLKDLEAMRAKISEILADRVKVDDQKVETLVQMYTNMKPPQAAKVFEAMDEDLAVEILSRMKKKSAADIMNLLPSAKAQNFSEKYAGYKRAPASK